MLQMNLITQEELYAEVNEELYEELYAGLYMELDRELYGEEYGELDWGLYKEVWREVYSPLGDQIRIDFHNSKFRGYNTICYK
jgi:hypothetical protein